MYAAYDGLSDRLKQTLAGLRAVHSADHIYGPDGAYAATDIGATLKGQELKTGAVHPVVITHPDSGKKALYVNPAFTLRFEGWTREESLPLLQYLYAQAMRPEITCTLKWRPGSIAVWDNRATWHFAKNDYHGERRLMHRITVAGVALV
jgi:taurine dioxygenase